ncbi:hypothetical protein [Arthrobacter sp. MDT2-2]
MVGAEAGISTRVGYDEKALALNGYVAERLFAVNVPGQGPDNRAQDLPVRCYQGDAGSRYIEGRLGASDYPVEPLVVPGVQEPGPRQGAQA